MPVCHSRDRLADEFAIATRRYYEAVLTITRNHVERSANEYGQLRKAAEEARDRSEGMRIAFDEHIDSHRCVAHEPTGGH